MFAHLVLHQSPATGQLGVTYLAGVGWRPAELQVHAVDGLVAELLAALVADEAAEGGQLGAAH